MFFKRNNFFFPLDMPKPRSSSVYFQLHNIEAVFHFCRIIYLISCVSWVLFGLIQLLVGCRVCFESEEVLSASERLKVTFKCKKLICWIYNKNLMVIAKKTPSEEKFLSRGVTNWWCFCENRNTFNPLLQTSFVSRLVFLLR